MDCNKYRCLQFSQSPPIRDDRKLKTDANYMYQGHQHTTKFNKSFFLRILQGQA